MDTQTNPLLDEYNNLSPGLRAALSQAGTSLAQGAGPAAAAAPQQGSLLAPKSSAAEAGLHSPAAASPAAPSAPTLLGGQRAGGASAPLVPARVAPSLPDDIDDDAGELRRIKKTGSGISQISGDVQSLLPNHAKIGKLLGGAAQGLATLGDIGLHAVSPGIEAMLPGTEGHHNYLLARQQGLLDHDYANQHTAAQSGLEGAQTDQANTRTSLLQPEQQDKHDLTQAQIGNYQSEEDARKNPLPKSPLELALRNNPNLTAQQWLDMEQHPISKDEADALNKTWDAIGPKYGVPAGQFKAGMPRADATALSGSLNNSIGKSQGAQKIVIQEGAADRKAANDPAVEREYQALHKDWNGQFSTATDQLTTLRQARSLIDSGAVGQALGQVKTLVGLAGGKGTGVRITQAELNALPAARGLGGDFEGFFNKLEGHGPLTHDQVHQVDELLSQAAALIQNKQAMYNNGLDRLGSAQTKEDLRKIDSDMRQQLMGGGGQQNTSPNQIFARDPQGKLHAAPAGSALPAGWTLEKGH